MPQLAVFPKAFMDALCVDGSMSVSEWISLAATLDVEGLEFYSGFLELKSAASASRFRTSARDHGLSIPMFCCSPDFTHPEKVWRQSQIDQQKRWIETAAELGASYCRVLSGQRRPEISREDGLKFAAESIEACLPFAAEHGVTLVIENHYKDNYWTYPEFAQQMDIFCDLIDRLPSTQFGVNYDPSNTLIAGEDPLELLRRVKHRVVTMHASDRYLKEGNWDDLRNEEMGVEGYAARLCHGEIGKGLNDYDAIFSVLRATGFDGWISIEDGVEGIEQLRRSVSFLREKITKHWGRPDVI